MAKPKLKQHHINRDWCKGCGICVELCPKKVLELDEQDKVRAALASLDINTFYGPIKFGANGMNAGRDLPILQVQGGKSVVLFPESIKQGSLQAVK
jgi:branched-chain amino acid transport system substrate-binding protein